MFPHSDLIRWRVLLIAALSVIGGMRFRQDAAERARSNRLRIGYLANLTHAVPLVGIHEGYYAQRLGSDVRVDGQILGAGNDLVTSLAAGELDAAYMGPGPALISQSAGVPLVPLAGAAYGGSVLVRKHGSPITSVRELSGKRMTVPKYGNTQDVLLRSLLDEVGVKDRARGGTADILQAEGADAVAMLRSGQVDGAMFPEPWASRAVADARAEVVLDAQQVWNGEYPSALLVVSRRYAEKYPERVRALVRAHTTLLDELASRPEQAQERTNVALTEHTHKRMRDQVIHQSFARMRLDARLDLADFQRFQTAMLHLGYLRRPVPLEAWLQQGVTFRAATEPAQMGTMLPLASTGSAHPKQSALASVACAGDPKQPPRERNKPDRGTEPAPVGLFLRRNGCTRRTSAAIVRRRYRLELGRAGIDASRVRTRRRSFPAIRERPDPSTEPARFRPSPAARQLSGWKATVCVRRPDSVNARRITSSGAGPTDFTRRPRGTNA